MTQVAIIAANAIMRNGIQAILNKSGIPPNGIATFESVSDFVAQPRSGRFAIALFHDDGCFQEVDSLLQKMLATNPDLKVLLLSERLLVAYIRRIIKEGASGFIYQHGDMEQSLPVALSAVKRGTVYLSPEVSEMLLNNELVSLSGLTKRDIAVLHLIAAELNVQEIAYHLHTSERTIYRSRSKLREALGVQTNEMIVDAARKQGLLEDV